MRKPFAIVPFLTVLLLGTINPASAYVIESTDKWGTPGFGNPGGTVTWSLIPTGAGVPGFPYVALQDFLPVGFESVLDAAFGAWAVVANISFKQVPDDGATFSTEPTAGVIRLAGIDLGGQSGILAQTQVPVGTKSESENPFDGTIRFTDNYPWALTDGTSGYNFFRVALHEIGHAIGLGDIFTSTPAVMDATYTEAFPLGLLPDDIAGVQFIYGPAEGSAPVPEPSTLLLLGSGLVGLGGKAWRRNRKN
jgi:hypothetical protein